MEVITQAERDHIRNFAQYVMKRSWTVKFFPNGSYEVNDGNDVIREEY